MMKLYCFPRSGNSREVKLVLAEKKVPFEAINVHAPDFDKASPEFVKASPGGKVPAIIDGDIYMSEAYHINEYLEKKFPRPAVLPADAAEQARIRDWVAVYDKKLVLKIGLLLIECILKQKEQQKEEVKQKFRAEILSALREVSAQLGDKEYLFGAYSLADISLTPHLAVLGRLGVEVPADLQNVVRWLERLKARPNFAARAE